MNDGDYGYSLLIHSPFPHSPSRPGKVVADLGKPPLLAQVSGKWFSARGVEQSRSMSGNPEMKPCFPRTVFPDPEYNQDQETQPYPAARSVL
jgi:hypothetical protein